eukprot:gene3607-6341_t
MKLFKQVLTVSDEQDPEVITESKNIQKKEKTKKKTPNKIIYWPEGLYEELFSITDLTNSVCKFLPPKDFINFSSVNKMFNKMLDSEDSWQNLTESHSGIFKKENDNLTWKQYYFLLFSDRWVLTGDKFGGAWAGEYWKVKNKVYTLERPLWWFSCGAKLKEVLPNGYYYGYWLICNGTDQHYNFKISLNGTTESQDISYENFKPNLDKWIVVRLGLSKSDYSTKECTCKIENIESSYKRNRFKIKWFKIAPDFASSIVEKDLKHVTKINDKCDIFKCQQI